MAKTIKPIQLAASRSLTFASGTSRHSNKVKNTPMKWADFVKKIESPVRTGETYAEFCKASKKIKDEIKDCGYFVGGHFDKGIRKKINIIGRDTITLDADHGGVDYKVLLELCLGPYTFVVYSTHSHSPRKPRLRIVFPLTRTVKPEEYEPLARKLAEKVGMDLFDDTTYQVSRAMYWPSVSSDGEYVCYQNEGEWVNPDNELSEYDNWQDVEEWPLSNRELEAPHKAIRRAKDKAEDPLDKPGVVGAFCRSHSISSAISEFIPEAYEEGSMEDRYSYAHGTTVNGAVVYEDKFLFSHHEKDPISGRLVNAFDLIRIHKFGYLDEDAKEGTPIHKTPSFRAMSEFAQQDPETKKAMIQGVTEGFENVDGLPDWLLELETNDKGDVLPKLTNIVKILSNDPSLCDRIALNELMGTPVFTNDLPWETCRDKTNGSRWSNNDDLMLRQFLEGKYKVEVSDARINDSVNLVAYEGRFHPVKDYLNSLEWDGEPRLETMLHRHVGTPRTPYTDAVSRKVMCAAVARVFKPGCKFDYVLILEGSQGRGKSTFIKTLAGDWFGDNVSSFKGKEAIESMMGQWVIELGELQAFGKAEIENIKAFISRREDRGRLAYDRRPGVYPRQTIFIGTTNSDDYLKDDTGNRRFWPVACEKERIDIEAVKAERDQLWAEAVALWKSGETLYFDSQETELLATQAQKERYAKDERAAEIERWLGLPIPKNYWDMSLSIHDGDLFDGIETMERDRTCVAEVWTECLGGNLKDLNRNQSVQIGRILRQIDGWEPAGKGVYFGKRYGKQKGFIKVTDNE